MSLDHPFARAFAEAWAKPTPERLVALLTPDVVLIQPHLPPIRGREASLAELTQMLCWLPGLHGEVHRAEDSTEFVFIEWDLIFPFGARGLRIPAVDRFRLHEGLGAERVVYFDQVPLLAAVAIRPWLWPGYLRYRFAGRRAAL